MSATLVIIHAMDGCIRMVQSVCTMLNASSLDLKKCGVGIILLQVTLPDQKVSFAHSLKPQFSRQRKRELVFDRIQWYPIKKLIG